MSGSRAPGHVEPGTLSLLIVVLRGSPRLPRALCRGETELFDAVNAPRAEVERAREICRQCPELQRCRDYTLGRGGLCGVWAGRYFRGRRGDDTDEGHEIARGTSNDNA